jgi:hypothetical protein
MQPISRQRIRKHAYNNRALFKTMFSIRSVQSVYKEDNYGNPVSWGLAVSKENI